LYKFWDFGIFYGNNTNRILENQKPSGRKGTCAQLYIIIFRIRAFSNKNNLTYNNYEKKKNQKKKKMEEFAKGMKMGE